MRRVLLAISLLVVFRCAAPAPEPVPAPPPPIVAAPEPVEEPVIGTVRVTASALNVRTEASTEAEVIAQAKKGQMLSVLAEDESWVRVKLANGDKGFVAARFVTHDVAKAGTKRKAPKKTGCPADSDFAFVETPTLAFSETPKPGMVVVEASVNTKGSVTATKVVSNSTGDETMAFLAQREIRSATFAPPIRNCVPRAFIFTYRRTF